MSRQHVVAKLIDLSMAVGPGGPVVIRHPVTTLAQVDTHERDGKSNTILITSLHTGTHIDAPFHFLPDGAPADQLPLERFVSVPGVKLDLRHLGQPHAAITRDELDTAAQGLRTSLEGAVCILHTGWTAARYYTGGYYGENPHLTPDATDWLVGHGINAVGLDSPPGPRAGIGSGIKGPGDSADIHRRLLGGDVLLIENLWNLDELPTEGFRVTFLPLKVVGGDGAPVRAIAVVS